MVQVKYEGPLFDGSFGKIVDNMVEDMTWEVGAQALANVHQNADGSFKNPTPYYETQITMQRETPGSVLVHDRGIIYGPWLERGRSTTRFRGYRIWRRAADETERQVMRLIDPILQRYLVRLRGGG